MNYLAAMGPAKVVDGASKGGKQTPAAPKERRGVLGWVYSWVR